WWPCREGCPVHDPETQPNREGCPVHVLDPEAQPCREGCPPFTTRIGSPAATVALPCRNPPSSSDTMVGGTVPPGGRPAQRGPELTGREDRPNRSRPSHETDTVPELRWDVRGSVPVL